MVCALALCQPTPLSPSPMWESRALSRSDGEILETNREKKNTSTLLGGTCSSKTNYAIERGVEGEAILKPSIQAALMSMGSPVGAGRLSNLKQDPSFM